MKHSQTDDPERKVAQMKKNGYLWNALAVLVLAAMTFVATGCSKDPGSDHPTKGDHPTTGEHPDHPKK